MERPEEVWALALPDRLWDRLVVNPHGCWIWQGSTQYGYSQIHMDGKTLLVHRVVWIAANGEPPKDTLDHLCRVRACANPNHLEPVSRGQNILRGEHPTAVAWRAGTCTKGHPKTEFVRRADGRTVYCKACRRERRAKDRREAAPGVR